jgi:uncharacterized damage-inducible protein DinB
MMTNEMKSDLRSYLLAQSDALVWKLDGLSEYDVRRPLVLTGTNLLGIVKHVASVAAGYFGDTFGRPFGEALPWFADDAAPNADLWATPEESREEIESLYRRVFAKVAETIDALDLDSEGKVPWWPEDRNVVTLHRVLVHMVTEVARHAGQADIVRELIDGSVGYRPDNDNLWEGDDGWEAHRARLEAAAAHFKDV